MQPNRPQLIGSFSGCRQGVGYPPHRDVYQPKRIVGQRRCVAAAAARSWFVLLLPVQRDPLHGLPDRPRVLTDHLKYSAAAAISARAIAIQVPAFMLECSHRSQAADTHLRICGRLLTPPGRARSIRRRPMATRARGHSCTAAAHYVGLSLLAECRPSKQPSQDGR